MKPFVIYNWKTYVSSVSDAVTLAGSLRGSDEVTSVVCPSALYLLVVADALDDERITLGVQDVSASAEHPQTGNLSGAQVKDVGALYVLVGHAETRAAGVTNGAVADKAEHALSSGLIPVVCLSEQKDKEGESDGEEVSEQLQEILSRIKYRLTGEENRAGPPCIVAYEPTAHIGADSALAPEKIKAVTSRLRGILQLGDVSGVPVIYGGSVAVENVKSILQDSGTDGFLIGRAGVQSETANTILSSF